MTDKAESLLGLDQEKSTTRTEAPASTALPHLTADERREIAWFVEHFALDKDFHRNPHLASGLAKLRGQE